LFLDIIHRNSQDDPNLQIADYIAGALYEKFEKGNDEEYLLIKDKIRYTALGAILALACRR
jgi:hypothetical protein